MSGSLWRIYVSCATCDRSVSDRATECPHCGALFGKLAFYFAQVDENGVLCVDRLAEEGRFESVEDVAALADSYPDMIYFAVNRT